MTRTALVMASLLLAGCPSPDNPARKAVDATTPAPPPTPAPAPAPTPTTGTAPAAATETWSCPMHPEVVQDHPGKCPKCGMDLVKKGS